MPLGEVRWMVPSREQTITARLVRGAWAVISVAAVLVSGTISTTGRALFLVAAAPLFLSSAAVVGLAVSALQS